MYFQNNNSREGYIGSYKSVDDVIARDELAVDRIINATIPAKSVFGSFNSVADRMEAILIFAKSLDMGKQETRMDEKVVITKVSRHFYDYSCPFKHCYPPVPQEGKAMEVEIVNPETGKQLTLNSNVEHLARLHHLLEKGNKYGIAAEEFYEQFVIGSVPFQMVTDYHEGVIYIPVQRKISEDDRKYSHIGLVEVTENGAATAIQSDLYNRIKGDVVGMAFAHTEFIKLGLDLTIANISFELTEEIRAASGSPSLIRKLTQREVADFKKGYERVRRLVEMIKEGE